MFLALCRNRNNRNQRHSNSHGRISNSNGAFNRRRVQRSTTTTTTPPPPPPCNNQTECSISCSSQGFNDGICGATCDCTPWTDETCNELCNLNGTVGIRCCENSCKCGVCDNQICKDSCNAQNLTGTQSAPTCYGTSNPTCVCDPDMIRSATCGSSFCNQFYGIYGSIVNCTDPDLLCTSSTSILRCDPVFCNSTCQASNSGTGSCIGYCSCARQPTNPSCG